jgi:Zn-finger nucleic acid-binding protein
MSTPLVCLGCGGIVDEGEGIPAGDVQCSCPPPSIEARSVSCPSCGGPLKVGARACPYCRSTLATQRCNRCFAWNLATAQHCQECGSGLSAAAEERAARSLSCPRCQASLSARRYRDFDVDECDGCGGFLVSPAMMDRIVSSRDSSTNLRLALPARPATRETSVRYIRCPACDKSMNRQAFGRISGVVVDVCREHGVWFDPGELGEVLAFVERGGLTRAREREAQELAEAARALRTERAIASVRGMTQSGGLAAQGSRMRHAGLEAEFVSAMFDLWK